MKIRTQFIISTAILGFILLLVSASVIFTNQWVENIHQQEVLATKIEREAYELSYLASDYLLYRESQQASRWESKFASLSDDLSKMYVNTPGQQALVAKIRNNHQRLRDVFAKVKEDIENAPQTQETGLAAKFMQVSWSRLEVQNQTMIFDISRLESMLAEQEDQLRWMTNLLIFVIIGMLGLYLLINYRLTFQRILQSIAGLQDGTRIIGSGDLDFAIAIKNEDEIGELSRAFNQMTTNLKQVTASKADLEKEIIERKQAEEALHLSEEKFALAFANNTAAIALTRLDNGVFLDVNNTWVALNGYSREEVIGVSARKLPIWPTAEAAARFTQELREKGTLHSWEQKFLKKSGEVFVAQLSAQLLTIQENEVILSTLVDITERKRVEEALRRSAALLLETGKMAKVGGWELDLQTMQLVWTSETYRIHEIDPSLQPELEGAVKFYAPEARPQITEAVRRATEEGQSYDLELPFVTAKGRNIWIRTIGKPEFHDGRCVKLFGTFQDITERKLADQNLIRHAMLLDISYEAIFSWELLNGAILTWNKGAERLYGYSSEEAIGQVSHQLLKTVHPQEINFIKADLSRNLTWTGELKHTAKNGSEIIVESRHQLILNESGLETVLETNRNITERRQAEEGLRRFELLSANSKDIILFMRRDDGRILEANAAALQAYGYSRDELLALTIRELRAQDTQSLTDDQMAQADTAGILFETVHLRKDGSIFPVEVSSQGATINGVRTLISVVRDIAERRQIEEKLALQAEDLRRSNTELEQFAYVASHDLQEPLRIMSNFSQLLERRYKGRLDQDADEFIGFIVDAASRMQKLITDLLAYSRAGHGDTNMAEVDCDRLVRKLVESMSLTIETADAQVTFDRLPVVTAHEASMIQLFQNLIGNALKFRGERPPRIHISAEQVEGEWVFSVADNGIGLEPQYNQRIFMIFQRLHARDKYPGTGIGLSICKKIVENLGGRIWVESEPGQGSTFTFTVPVNINTKGVTNG